MAADLSARTSSASCHHDIIVAGMARVSTNVPLDEAQLHQLKRLAVERGVSLSALFQELIADYLVRVSTLTGRDWRADPFFQVGRRPGRSGHSRVAEEHDRHLYRERRCAPDPSPYRHLGLLRPGGCE